MPTLMYNYVLNSFLYYVAVRMLNCAMGIAVGMSKTNNSDSNSEERQMCLLL